MRSVSSRPSLSNAAVAVLALLVSVGPGALPEAPPLRPEARTEAFGRHHRHRRTTPRRAPPRPPPVAPLPIAPERAGVCPAGMVLVDGSFCPDARQRCELRDPEERDRCLRFRAPTVCRSRARRPLRYCIDRYEWPGREGAIPAVMVSWNDAARLCADVGRRLCTEDEWTLACEGPAMLPYPWGYARDETACNIDREGLAFDRARMRSDDRSVADAEAARVSQSRPSGAFPRCVSPYGVSDMTGNVDEWTVSRAGHRFQSALKGGYWGRIRARCRPATRRHDERFRYYQIGFRCCAGAR
jgi:sulfatase modifying factor 1